jgi:Flp pilus assembly protein TadG
MAPRQLSRRDVNWRVKDFIADESGAIALVMAFVLVGFLGMGALAIDISYMSSVQNDLKKAAEAGALAGAAALGSSSSPDWSKGQTAAEDIVTKNYAVGQPLTDCQVDGGYWDLSSKSFVANTTQTLSASQFWAIRVVVDKNVPLSFAPILGLNNKDLTGTAVAMLKSGGLSSIYETGNGQVIISNNANVSGDVGVNGGGPFTLSNNATVQGKAYLNTACSKSIGNNATIKGGIQQDAGANAILQQATQDANTAYNNFVGHSNTKGNITKVNTTRTLPAGTSGYNNYLDVTNFVPSNNAIITINAPAGSSYIIRVSGNFTLSNNSQVVLSGGIMSDGVTFVYKKVNGTATLSNNSILYGSILSPNSKISLSNNAAIKGGVLVSGKNISLSNNSVTTDKMPSGWGSFSSGGGTPRAHLVQ